VRRVGQAEEGLGSDGNVDSGHLPDNEGSPCSCHTSCPQSAPTGLDSAQVTRRACRLAPRSWSAHVTMHSSTCNRWLYFSAASSARRFKNSKDNAGTPARAGPIINRSADMGSRLRVARAGNRHRLGKAPDRQLERTAQPSDPGSVKTQNAFLSQSAPWRRVNV
jgi:hypothetical protein